MIEIITEHVEMPELDKRRYQKNCVNPHTIKQDKWVVIDTQDNSIRYKGAFEDVAIACHNLNKKFYRDIANKKAVA